MLPVKYLAPNIVMAVNYSGSRLASRIVWAATDHHKKEDATTHHGACKHILQYDGNPDWRNGHGI